MRRSNSTAPTGRNCTSPRLSTGIFMRRSCGRSARLTPARATSSSKTKPVFTCKLPTATAARCALGTFADLQSRTQPSREARRLGEGRHLQPALTDAALFGVRDSCRIRTTARATERALYMKGWLSDQANTDALGQRARPISNRCRIRSRRCWVPRAGWAA